MNKIRHNKAIVKLVPATAWNVIRTQSRPILWSVFSWAVWIFSPVALQAQLTYTANGNTAIISGYTGNIPSPGELVIPGIIDGLPVELIGTGSFHNRQDLTRVTISDGVMSIGDSAFSGCYGLTSMSIPDSVAHIGDSAFEGCLGLENVILGSGVVSIGNYAFSDCSGLTRVTIPGTVTSLGNYAFCNCFGLAFVTFEGNSPSAGFGLFYNCNPTVYFLPGTTGWETIFEFQPAFLWNPTAPPGDPSFGVRNGIFGFNIVGTSGIAVVIEASRGLAPFDLVPVSTNTLTTGYSYFVDPASVTNASAFYRFRTP